MSVEPMMSVWARMARELPHAPALTVGETVTLDWQELQARSNSLARLYVRHGVVQGDLVTIGLPTGVDAVLAMLAAIKLGATPNPISWRLRRPSGGS